jgi:hypothetical protein
MSPRVPAAVAGLALLAQSCVGSITTPVFNEGEQVMRAAPQGPEPSAAEPLKSAEPIRTLAVLTAGDEVVFVPNWDPRTAYSDPTVREGMGVGFLTGMNLISLLPLFVATPVVVGGLLGLATAVGGIAGATQAGQGHWKPTADQKAMENALGRMRPQADVRERFREEVQGIVRGPAPAVAQPAAGPNGQPVDYAALAKDAGADAVADLRIVAFGVAGGEMIFSLAVFAGVRARVFRASDGALIYDKIIAQSTEAPLPDSPPPSSYTMELLAMDDGRVFRHEVGQALKAIAHAIATDPDLRLAVPPAPAAASDRR